jgi:hypothetical protein
VGTGSHSNQVYADCVDLSAVENASNKEIEPPFRFNRNGKGSGPARMSPPRLGILPGLFFKSPVCFEVGNTALHPLANAARQAVVGVAGNVQFGMRRSLALLYELHDEFFR